jgi:DNA-binding XRE family transcriptional regulator
MQRKMIAQHHFRPHNPRLGVGGRQVPPPKYPSRLHQILGERLRERRLAAGLTLQEAAARAGITAAAWSAFERGRTLPSLSRLASVAAAIGCEPADLVS